MTMTREEYIAWMYDKGNSHQCEGCPENKGCENYSPDYKLPCGQQNCWVDCHCGKVKE